MSFLDKIASWFTSPRQFTDEQLLAGPAGDTIDHGFHVSEEDHIRVLEYRLRAEHLSERQVRLVRTKIADLKKRIVDREVHLQEQRERERRRIAEEAVNAIEKKPTASVRVPQPSGGSTPVKSHERLADRIADLADSVPTHTPSHSTHSYTPSHSVSYSSHSSSHSHSCSSSSSSDSSSSSSSSSGCD